MKRLKLLCFLLFATLFCTNTSSGATANLLVGQSYQTEISSTGYHYLSIEEVSSTNPSISVTKMGLVVKATVNAYFYGEAIVTARLRYQLYAGQSYQYRNQEFTISCSDTQISVTPSTATMQVGDTQQISFHFNRPTYVSPSISWTSSDETIVTVSSDGIVRGVAEGNAVIYVRSNIGSNTAQCIVRVTNDGHGENSGDGSFDGADTSWYNESQPLFEISTLGQLIGFRELVNNGTDFQDKTIKLTSDIDMSDYNWAIPIGLSESKRFKGTFDGNGYTIKIFMSIKDDGSQSKILYGLFGYNGGTIRGLTVMGSINVEIADFTTYCYLGAICAYNSRTIENCINKANVRYKRSYVKSTGNEDFIGGIAGASYYVTGNCINEGEVLCESRFSSANTNSYYTGGIAGLAQGRVYNCSNKALIHDNTFGNSDNIFTATGGVVGIAGNITVERNSNFGNIKSYARNSGTAGIIGNANANTVCRNNYVGKCEIINTSGSSVKYLNAIVGRIVWSNFSATFNYSANDISYNDKNGGEGGNTTYSSAQMQTTDFASVLGNGSWLGAEGLYPVVKGSLEEYNYYISTVSNILCNKATISSNVWDVLASDIKSWGFLLTLDDGRESYIPGEIGQYSIVVNGLQPDRNYKVRWYAQNKQNKEYYGIHEIFKTRSLNPTTLPNPVCGVFGVKLQGESYYDGTCRYGFYIQKNNSEENGQYYWADTNESERFEVPINGLKGNTKYNYCAIIDVNGIISQGETLRFATRLVSTSFPSYFTNSGAVFNGEIGVEVSSAWFEFRADSWPSVIESEKVNITNFNIGRVSAQSPTLQLNETYKYRLAVVNNGEIVYGDWLEFKFEGETGIGVVPVDDIDDSNQIYVYNLSGQQVYKGMKENITFLHGIYIIKQGNRTYKIKI